MTNAYWEAVREHVDPTGSLWNTPDVGGYGRYRLPGGRVDFDRWHREGLSRTELVDVYSWTITDPATVAFVAEHAGPRVVDPMAGSGWWAKLLTDAGADVVAYDLYPPGSPVEGDEPKWHQNQAPHHPVMLGEAVETVAVHSDRTLLLSWPIYGCDARPILAAHGGQRLVYIGEDWGGCCADDAFFEELTKDWAKVAECVPVQWHGIHDIVHVYERGGAS